MLESTENKIKSRKIYMIVQIAAIAIALATWLIVQFAVGKEKLGFAPIFMLFIVYFLASGVVSLVLALIGKSTHLMVTGGIEAVIGLEFLLFCVCNKKFWWVYIMIGLIVLGIIFLATFATKAKTLEIEFDNAEDKERKTYAERKAEKEAFPEEEEQVLPEIKSFKD